MENRINILVENNVVDQDIADHTLRVHRDIILENGFEGSASETFLTHLAMASQRIRESIVVAQMDDAILNDIKAFAQFDEVVDYVNLILKDSVVKFPDEEIDYLWLHMCNVMNDKGGK